MKRRYLSAIILLVLLLGAGSYVLVRSNGDLARAAPDRARVAAALQSVPVMFIENLGQIGEGARFQVRGGDHTLWLAEDALWITVVETPARPSSTPGRDPYPPAEGETEEREPRRGLALKLSFPGANPHPRLEPFNRLDTHVSYFIGNDPAKWRADVPVWGRVRYKDLYPGIDLELTGENGHWQWRLVTALDGNLDAVRLRVEGAEAVRLEDNHLRLTTGLGDFTLPRLTVESARHNTQPSISQLEGGTFEVASPFTFASSVDGLSEQVADASDLAYSTFLGGASDDYGGAIAADSSGVPYVTGWTYSSDFPTTPGAFDTSYNGGYYGDAFVAKLNATGTGLAYSTFLGGASDDYGGAIAVDASGALYVTGETRSSDFPTTPGAFDTSCGTDGNCNYDGLDYYRDVFVVKLNADGTGLAYSTFLGGADSDWGRGIAVDSSGVAYVTGGTHSSDFPATTGAFDTTQNGYVDVFVAKLNAVGTGLAYGTFVGGGSLEWGEGIAVDASGAAYVTGGTSSSDFPTSPGAFDTTHNGYVDVFVAKLNAAGTGLAYSTFLGGAEGDVDAARDIGLDGSGNAYVTGGTDSSDFPTTPGAFDTSYNGGYYGDAFVAKLNATGTGLAYSTFLGGASDDYGGAIAADSSGVPYVTGWTYSSDFPTTPGAFDTSCGTDGNCNYDGLDYYRDVFVVKLNADGTGLAYSTFLGGADSDWGSGIAVDSSGAAYVMGGTESSDFPTTTGAFDTTYNAGEDAFVAKLALGEWGYRVYLPLILKNY